MSCESSLVDLTTEGMMLEGGDEEEDENCREQLLSQIKELHEAVVEMKSAFTSAQSHLQEASVGEEASLRVLRDQIDSTRAQSESSSSDILTLLLNLKGEVGCVKEALQSTQLIQHGIQASLHNLLSERDLILDELSKAGAISDGLRVRLHTRLNGINLPRPSSGSHSSHKSESTSSSNSNSNDNDSGVGVRVVPPLVPLLMEKTPSGSDGVDDPDGPSTSLCHHQLKLQDFKAIHQQHSNVQEYLNTLAHPHGNKSEDKSKRSSKFQQGNNNHPAKQNGINNDDEDSDSSLTLEAAKSLSLSNSLSKQCGLELDQEQINLLHDDEEDNLISLGETTRNKVSSNGHGLNSNSDPYLSELAQGPGGGPYQSETPQTISYKEGQRYKVAKEMLETERKYCHTLKTIQETFALPLREAEVLSLKDINTLFPEEVFALYDHHCILLAQLEERVASWKSRPIIGDIIEEFINDKETETCSVLSLYTNYVNDFPEVLKTFQKLCRTSKVFTQFVKGSLEHPSCGGLDLGAFLLSPVQRMPRYILLLKQLIKYTDPAHPDFKDVTTCLDRLRDYLRRLNDSMEHSFQLVTAQMNPNKCPESDDDEGDDREDEEEGEESQPLINNSTIPIPPNVGITKEKEKKIGFTNALGLGFGCKSIFPSRNGSVSGSSGRRCSSQEEEEEEEEYNNCHDDEEDEDMAIVKRQKNNKADHKYNNKRSTSVPRCRNEPACDPKHVKTKSKSEWAVCKSCNCGDSNGGGGRRHGVSSTSPSSSLEGTYHNPNNGIILDDNGRRARGVSIHSDSDDDDEEDALGRRRPKVQGRKFSTSKSLHDFPHEEIDHHHVQDDVRRPTFQTQPPEWYLSQPSLFEGATSKDQDSSGGTLVRNKVLIRPLTSAHAHAIPPSSSSPPHQRYIARLKGHSESDMNLHMLGSSSNKSGGGHIVPDLHKSKKKSSFTTSLKNLFSIKKRTTRTLQISGPILPSSKSSGGSSSFSSTKSNVTTLRYNNGREVYQNTSSPISPPPHPPFKPYQKSVKTVRINDEATEMILEDQRVVKTNPLLLRSNGNNESPPSRDSSYPPLMPKPRPRLFLSSSEEDPHPPEQRSKAVAAVVGRYCRNPGSKFSNPKLPKSPYIKAQYPETPPPPPPPLSSLPHHRHQGGPFLTSVTGAPLPTRRRTSSSSSPYTDV